MTIRIKAKKDGFRRAGLAHYGVMDYPDDYFTPDQLEALKAEPNLVVTEIDEAPPEPSDPEPPAPEPPAPAAPEPEPEPPAKTKPAKPAK